MMARLYCFLVFMFLYMLLILVGASSRQFSPSHSFAPNDNQIGGTVQSSKSFQIAQSSNHALKGMKEKMELVEKYKEIGKIGSSPPSCEDKCYGCNPCEATQVPTITSRVGVQYTNYEPEGWKCKCGPTFFSP